MTHSILAVPEKLLERAQGEQSAGDGVLHEAVHQKLLERARGEQWQDDEGVLSRSAKEHDCSARPLRRGETGMRGSRHESHGGADIIRDLISRLRSRGKALRHLLGALAHRGGRPPLPSFAHFNVTWRCSLKCRACKVWTRGEAPEMSTREALAVIGKLPFLDIIKLTGGEPFMREDLTELVLAIRRSINPCILQLITSGWHSDAVLDLAARAGWPGLHLRLSADGMGETHDRLRGQPGAWSALQRTVEGLLPLRRAKRFALGINYNVTDETLPHLEAMAALCRRERINLVPGFPVAPFLEESGALPRSSILVRDRALLRESFPGLYQGADGFNALEAGLVRRRTLDVIRGVLENPESLGFRCLELRNLLYLAPTGDIITCGLKQEPIGNLVHRSFDDIWFGEAIAPSRRAVADCPGCLQLAIRIASDVYGGRIFRR